MLKCKLCDNFEGPEYTLEGHFIRDHPDKYEEYLEWHKQQKIFQLEAFETARDYKGSD